MNSTPADVNTSGTPKTKDATKTTPSATERVKQAKAAVEQDAGKRSRKRGFNRDLSDEVIQRVGKIRELAIFLSCRRALPSNVTAVNMMKRVIEELSQLQNLIDPDKEASNGRSGNHTE